MFEPFRLLKPLDIFVHSVLPCQLVTPWKMIDSLVREQRLEQIGIGIGTCPHEVKILVETSDLCEPVGKEDLADDPGLAIDQPEGEVVPHTGRVGTWLPQNVTIEHHDWVSLREHSIQFISNTSWTGPHMDHSIVSSISF